MRRILNAVGLGLLFLMLTGFIWGDSDSIPDCDDNKLHAVVRTAIEDQYTLIGLPPEFGQDFLDRIPAMKEGDPQKTARLKRAMAKQLGLSDPGDIGYCFMLFKGASLTVAVVRDPETSNGISVGINEYYLGQSEYGYAVGGRPLVIETTYP